MVAAEFASGWCLSPRGNQLIYVEIPYRKLIAEDAGRRSNLLSEEIERAMSRITRPANGALVSPFLLVNYGGHYAGVIFCLGSLLYEPAILTGW